MTYNHLTAEERGQIEAYLDEGLSCAEIARRLNRHLSTISREIKRGGEQRKNNSIAVRKNLNYLNKKYSPEQIFHSVRSINVLISTIYNWIYAKIVPFSVKKLCRCGKRYKVKTTGKRLKRPDRLFF